MMATALAARITQMIGPPFVNSIGNIPWFIGVPPQTSKFKVDPADFGARILGE
jgi:hypothetical protein